MIIYKEVIMKLFRFKISTAITLASISLAAHADLSVVNHTESFGTAYLSTVIASSPCSSRAGDRGIMKPNGKLDVPQAVFTIFCGLLTCEAHIYADTNCGGNEVTRITVDPYKGITDINNLDPEHYVASHSGNDVIMDPGPGNKNLFQRLFRWF